MNFIKIGWNGFLFETPKDFRLVSERGNSKTGYMRLETENGIVELKWEPYQPGKAKSISEVASEFIKKIQKSKKKVNISVKKTKATSVNGHDASFISLKTDLEESIYLWYCEESSRIIICHFAFPSINEFSRVSIEKIIDTMKCHSKGIHVWSLLGFTFKAPSSFMLNERRMTVGGSRLILVESKLSPYQEVRREIYFQYYSMANLLFKEDYNNPAKWLEKNYIKNLRQRYGKIKFDDAEICRFKRHKAAIRKGESSSGLLSRRKSYYQNLTWYCTSSNRIYTVTVSSHLSRIFFLKKDIDPHSLEEFAEKIFSTIRCH